MSNQTLENDKYYNAKIVSWRIQESKFNGQPQINVKFKVEGQDLYWSADLEGQYSQYTQGNLQALGFVHLLSDWMKLQEDNALDMNKDHSVKVVSYQAKDGTTKFKVKSISQKGMGKIDPKLLAKFSKKADTGTDDLPF